MLAGRNKVALTYKNQEYTYKQLLQVSQMYADAFSKDCQPAKVVIHAEN